MIDLPMPVAMDMARAAIFERAVAVTFSPEFMLQATLTDQRKPKCKRLNPRRVRCSYRFTIEGDSATLYDERGRVRVGKRTKLTVQRILRPTRDGA